MGILSRFQAHKEQKEQKEQQAYEREVLWRQRNIPYGEMMAQTVVYQRKFALETESAPKQVEAVQRLKAKVRTAFLSHPATTEADFERCWPMLRDEIFTQHTRQVLETERVSRMLAANEDGKQ